MKWYHEADDLRDFPNQSMFDTIWNNNKNHLEDIALHYYGNKITFGKLFNMISVAEGKISSLGLLKGDTVAFISIFTPEMIAMFYALNKVGVISCMMDPRTSPDCLAKYIENAKVKCLFVQDACLDVANEVLTIRDVSKVVVLDTAKSMGFPTKQFYTITSRKKILTHESVNYSDIKIENSRKEVILEKAGDLPAVICYTGGTTGESKGVLLSNNNTNALIEQAIVLGDIFIRRQKWLSPSVPFIAYYLVCSHHIPLSLGMQCYMEVYDNAKMKKMVLKNKINHIFAIPSFYEELFDGKEDDYSYIVMPTTGGDKLSEKTYNTVNNALKKGHSEWKICNGYGMTEVSSAACLSMYQGCNKIGSAGIPLFKNVVSAFDPETGEECKIGEQGEICISGPGVMIGYLNNEAATREVIKEHQGRRWMHTGDLGHIDEDGCVFIDGRMKRMIVRFDGFKIFPTLVEEKILTCKLIENCSCVGMSDEEHGVGQVSVVFYTTKDNSIEPEVIEEELRKTSLELLPKYSQPFAYKKIDELPRTKVGKIDYRKLEKML